MAWIGISEYGATQPFFLEPGKLIKFLTRLYVNINILKGSTINADVYVNRILPFAKREGAKLFGRRRWLFQQDGATSHTSNKSQKWCKNNFHLFLDKHHWPPNSPDLSPLDYFFWNEVENNMTITPFMKINEFKEEIKRGCSLVKPESIKKAVASFTSRVRAVEEAGGIYLEKRKINKN